jgi:hypothetical protein
MGQHVFRVHPQRVLHRRGLGVQRHRLRRHVSRQSRSETQTPKIMTAKAGRRPPLKPDSERIPSVR